MTMGFGWFRCRDAENSAWCVELDKETEDVFGREYCQFFIRANDPLLTSMVLIDGKPLKFYKHPIKQTNLRRK